MKLHQYLGATALAGAIVAACPGIAMAQATAPVAQGDVTAPASQQQDVQDEAPGGEIVVTGSRIRRPNDSSPIPITSLGSQEIFETGRISVGDTLN